MDSWLLDRGVSASILGKSYLWVVAGVTSIQPSYSHCILCLLPLQWNFSGLYSFIGLKWSTCCGEENVVAWPGGIDHRSGCWLLPTSPPFVSPRASVIDAEFWVLIGSHPVGLPLLKHSGFLAKQIPSSTCLIPETSQNPLSLLLLLCVYNLVLFILLHFYGVPWWDKDNSYVQWEVFKLLLFLNCHLLHNCPAIYTESFTLMLIIAHITRYILSQ